MQYRYTGSDERVYPYARIDGGTRPLVVSPGDVVDLDEAPNDARWEEVPEVKPEPVKTVAAKAAAPKE